MWIIFISIFVVLADQISKLMVLKYLQDSSITLIQGVFDLTFVKNFGAAFGTFQNAKWLFLVVTPIITVMFVYLLLKDRLSLQKNIALALIIGGAIGNYIDRVRLGYVVDFLDFKVWPVFNIADSAIVVGVFIYITYLLFFNEKMVIKGEEN